MPPKPEVTRILERAERGDRAAAAELLPLVYEQLRASAQKAMAAERPGHTLTATALVHEAYARLIGPGAGQFRGRAHFYAAAAQAMRQHLIDHARARLAQKRGGAAGPARREPMESLREVADLAAAQDPEEILSLDAAVSRLEGVDPPAASVVRLRFYAGLGIDETAAALGLSPATVKREWQFARAWLFRELNERKDGP